MGDSELREPKLLDRVRQATRVRHLSPKTEPVSLDCFAYTKYYPTLTLVMN
jgi:hypothetical protein